MRKGLISDKLFYRSQIWNSNHYDIDMIMLSVIGAIRNRFLVANNDANIGREIPLLPEGSPYKRVHAEIEGSNGVKKSFAVYYEAKIFSNTPCPRAPLTYVNEKVYLMFGDTFSIFKADIDRNVIKIPCAHGPMMQVK